MGKRNDAGSLSKKNKNSKTKNSKTKNNKSRDKEERIGFSMGGEIGGLGEVEMALPIFLDDRLSPKCKLLMCALICYVGEHRVLRPEYQKMVRAFGIPDSEYSDLFGQLLKVGLVRIAKNAAGEICHFMIMPVARAYADEDGVLKDHTVKFFRDAGYTHRMDRLMQWRKFSESEEGPGEPDWSLMPEPLE